MDEHTTSDTYDIASMNSEVPAQEASEAAPQSTPAVTQIPVSPTSSPDNPTRSFSSGLLIAGVVLLLVLAAAAAMLRKKAAAPVKKPNTPIQKPAEGPGKTTAAVSVANPAAASSRTIPSTSPLKAAPDAPKYRLGYAETIGKRKQQEDSRGASNPSDAALISRQGLLAIVADGIGGLGDGQVASNMAVRAMLSAFEKLNPSTPAPDRLLQLTALAQNSVSAASQQSGKRMGCTLVSVLVHNNGLSFLSIGDSRICLLRGGALLTLNREHVLGREHDEQVALGEASGEMEHKRRIRITSYIGIKNLSLIDRNLRPLRLLPGDKILLMSDGVFNTLSDEELIACMNAPAMQAAGQAIRAVESKNYPGQDNATIMVIEYP